MASRSPRRSSWPTSSRIWARRWCARSRARPPMWPATVRPRRRFLRMAARASSIRPSLMEGYPPYNIERTAEDAYRISLAVAGFTDADLSIEAKENRLTIRGEKQTNDEEQTGEVLYRGIAARTFERNYQLADHVEVKGARLENGLLHVDLVR